MDVRPPNHSWAEPVPFFETAPDAFVVTDLTGSVIAINAQARGILERPLADGTVVDELFTHVDRPHVLRALRSLVQATTHECDLRVSLDHRREPAPVWVRAARTEWGASPVPSVLWIVRTLGVMEESQARLQRANALKDAYLLALAHDLRSPVSVIRNVSDLLGASSVTERTIEVIGRALVDAVQEVDSIITDLLDVERLEHEGVDVLRKPTDLRALVERCVERAGVSNVVDVNVPRGSANVDAAICERILDNVLANARHHGPSDGRMRVRAIVDEHSVRFQVDDEGPGIPDPAKEVVFDLFQQLRSKGAGVGVGLYLVRRFAVLHGGWATVVDGSEGGTSIRVRLATRT